jgi:hypothetical protein
VSVVLFNCCLAAALRITSSEQGAGFSPVRARIFAGHQPNFRGPGYRSVGRRPGAPGHRYKLPPDRRPSGKPPLRRQCRRNAGEGEAGSRTSMLSPYCSEMAARVGTVFVPAPSHAAAEATAANLQCACGYRAYRPRNPGRNNSSRRAAARAWRRGKSLARRPHAVIAIDAARGPRQNLHHRASRPFPPFSNLLLDQHAATLHGCCRNVPGKQKRADQPRCSAGKSRAGMPCGENKHSLMRLGIQSRGRLGVPDGDTRHQR